MVHGSGGYVASGKYDHEKTIEAGYAGHCTLAGTLSGQSDAWCKQASSEELPSAP